MMDCRHFRETLDLFVDGELSAEAMAAADMHRRDCARCAAIAAELQSLRRAVRRTVESAHPSASLPDRVRESIYLAPVGASERARPAARFTFVAAFATAALLLLAAGLTLAALQPASVRDSIVSVLDHAVAALAVARPIDLEATVLCRDCTLHERHGEAALCDRFGHRGALATSDGRLWNIMEQDGSLDLVHDEAMLGQRVRVHGTLYRDAGTIAVDSYELLVSMTMAASHAR